MWVYDVKKGEATRTSLEGSEDLLDYGSFIKELLVDTNATLLGEGEAFWYVLLCHRGDSKERHVYNR